MDSHPAPDVSADPVAAYARDGVACVRGLLDAAWVERLRIAVDRIKARPGPLRQRLRPEDPGEFFSEKFMWTFDPDFRALLRESPVAAAAATLMGARKINIFYDQILVKEPGTEAPSPWHQDLNYFPFFGRPCCSVWIPLDPVDRQSGVLEFVRGSHAWHDRPFNRPIVFGKADHAPRAHDDPDAVDGELAEMQPDIEADRAAYDIVSWDMAPGDAVVFSALALHAAPGNASARRRRAVSIRLTGDDVRYAKKRKRAQILRDPGLKPGDAMDCDLFPVIWRTP